MISRRNLLQIGVSGAVLLPLIPLDPLLAWVTVRPYKVIFDQRFPASVAFAKDAARSGIPVHAIRGDVTALWYNDLYFRWKEGAAPIAGITTGESLFCLEVLARDAGLSVTERRRCADGLITWSIGAKESTADDLRLTI